MAGRVDKHTKVKEFFLVPSYKISCLEGKAADIQSNTQDTEQIPDNTAIIPGNTLEDSVNTQEYLGNTDRDSGYTDKHLSNTEENNHVLSDMQAAGHTSHITPAPDLGMDASVDKVQPPAMISTGQQVLHPRGPQHIQPLVVQQPLQQSSLPQPLQPTVVQQTLQPTSVQEQPQLDNFHVSHKPVPLGIPISDGSKKRKGNISLAERRKRLRQSWINL